MAAKMWIVLSLISAFVCTTSAQTRATCTLIVNSALDPDDQQPLEGTLTLTQDVTNGPITITGTITGFKPNDNNMLHGFHVHSTTDYTNGCDSTGPHFNPTNMDHGARGDVDRHVGDLGNIEEDVNGDCFINMADDVIKFSGDSDISGKPLVVHAWEDDLGLTNHTDSPTTGNAGPRLACCTIEVQSGGNTLAMTSVNLLTSLISFMFVVFVGKL